MKRRTNVLRRNSGFIAACAIVAAASFIIVDASMSGILSVELSEESADESEEMALTVKKTAPEDTNEVRTYETDVFTVTASGRVRNGVETERTGGEIFEAETDEAGNVLTAGASEESGLVNGAEENGSYDADEGNIGYAGGDAYDSDGGVGISDADGGSSGQSFAESGAASETEEEVDTIIPGISSRYIDVSELYPYDREELRIIRYEIYALHGRIFMSDDLAEYFDGKSWYKARYMPDYFDENLSEFLNQYELANLQTIKDYEAAFDDD